MRWGWVCIIMVVVVTDEEGSDPRASAARAWYTPYHTTHLSSVRRLIREWTRYQPSFVKMEICILVRDMYTVWNQTYTWYTQHPSLCMIPLALSSSMGIPHWKIFYVSVSAASASFPRLLHHQATISNAIHHRPHIVFQQILSKYTQQEKFFRISNFGWVVICINCCLFLVRYVEYIGSSEFKIDVELLSQLSD